MEIYISTLALRGYSPEFMIELAKKNGWALEFSSGMNYREDMELLYNNAEIKRMPHNYFPAPKKPFVLNLASINDDIRTESIQHCLQGLKIAKFSKSPFFAAHAGFCIDPAPEQLGNKIEITSDFDREKHKSYFIDSVKQIVSKAKELKINFLIENNVVAGFNYNNDLNPFFCCDGTEIQWLFEEINENNFGILLDTAHLKVSCQTLNLKIEEEFQIIKNYIKGIHHSDNDGKNDDNSPLTSKYWFLPFLHKFLDIPHILEVKDLSDYEINKQIKYLNTKWNY
jgi:sugar phosphate isomerase/epimerase